MNPASWVLFCLAGLGLFGTALGVACARELRRRRLPKAKQPLDISIIKPLCGLDECLEENLESHLAIAHEGAWEVVLGLHSDADPAYPLAQRFAVRHPDRVRVVLQQGEPGYNPKVNQLITLTRAARHPVIAVTDSNVRVPPSFLSEISDALQLPDVAIATHLFVGLGERRLGAVLDNLTLTVFTAPSLAGSSLLLKLDQVVGKSMAMRKEALEQVGGWQAVKDKLAEDQQLGLAFRELGLHSFVCPSPVENVQRDLPLAAFWRRQCRWLMIRYRTFFPGVLLEPVMLPTLLAGVAVALSPGSALAWALCGCAWAAMMTLTDLSARTLRGRGFALKHLLLTPLRELVFFAAWARGSTLKRVNWRGKALQVLNETRLVPTEPPGNVHRLGRS